MGCPLPSAIGESRIVSGTVQAVSGEMALVCGPAGQVKAVRAAGCLLAPRPGDKVLLALLEDGGAWILSVLLRKQDAAALLSLPGHTRLDLEELEISAGKTRITSPDLSMTGDCLSIRAGVLAMGGKILLQGFGSIRSIACHVCEQAMKKLSEYGSRSEHVQGLDELRAGRIREESAGTYRLRAEIADIRAGVQLDLDAEHIKVG